MSETNPHQPGKKFQIGLTMAGAISAGAYTAGVIDYLLETLQRWEEVKGKQADMPSHEVEIPVITGASAGGMTAVMIAKALYQETKPVERELKLEENSSNILYDCWVNLTESVGSPVMLDQLLSLKDLQRYEQIPYYSKLKSLFNSSFIEDIANKHIPNSASNHTPAGFVPKDLELLLTLTNIQGFKFVEKFNPTATSSTQMSGVYKVVKHADYGNFVIGKNSYANDGRIPIDFGSPNKEDLNTLRQCAMATGAFPVGLSYREVKRKVQYIKDNPWINLDPSIPLEVGKDQTHNALMVDGGAINNEPYKMAIRLLNKRRLGNKSEDYLSEPLRNAAILMVDPFPTEEENESKPNFDPGLMGIIPALVNAMQEQLLYSSTKGNEFYRESQNNRPLYLISPTRKDKNAQTIIGNKAIACGSLGGFGGLLSRDFRQHDFFLGRRNCQRFLQKYFVVEWKDEYHTNPNLFENDYYQLVLSGYSGKKEAVERYKVFNEGKWYVPIIPDTKYSRAEEQNKMEVKQPEWKKIDFCKDIYRIKPQIKKRLKTATYAAFDPGLFVKVAINLGFGVLGNTVSDMVLKHIKNELESWELLE